MVDAAGQREKALESPRDIVLDLFGWHSGEKRGHDDNRDFDWRKQIDWHPHNAADADHTNNQTDNDDEKWISESEARHGDVKVKCGSFKNARLFDEFRLDLLADFELGTIADNNKVVLIQAADDFDLVRRFEAGIHSAGFEMVIFGHEQNRAGTFTADGLDWNGERFIVVFELKRHRRVHAGDK